MISHAGPAFPARFCQPALILMVCDSHAKWPQTHFLDYRRIVLTVLRKAGRISDLATSSRAICDHEF